MIGRTTILFAICTIFFVGCGKQPPSTAELETAILQYAQSESAAQKGAKVSKPQNVRLGKYNKQLGGWEVYARYTVSYRENEINFNVNVTEKSPAAYAKYSGSNLVCFKPEIFAMLESELKSELGDAFDGFK